MRGVCVGCPLQTDELKKNAVARGRLGGRNGGEMTTRDIQRVVAAMPQYRCAQVQLLTVVRP